MVKSPIKIIDSGTAPTTENLGEGQIAFGTVDGATKLYGSDGTTVSELGGGSGQGPQGPAGQDGITPTIGDNGNWFLGETDTGKPSRGEQGPAGTNGADGAPGTPGADGAPGAAAGFGTVSATVDSNTGTPSVEVATSGDNTAKNFTFTFHNLKGEKGDTGAQGNPGPQGEPGQDGTPGAAGAPGAAATITVGTTTTGEAGTEAAVTNSGTTSAAVLNFTIPKGAKGDKGDKGDTGPQGNPGEKGDPGEAPNINVLAPLTVSNAATSGSPYGVAIGDGASVTGTGSVAIGFNASGTQQSVSIGQGATTDNGLSIGMMSNSVASSVAIGKGASATAVRSMAIGNESIATESDTVSFGGKDSGRGTIETSRLVNVTDPVNAQDAATKAYVDSKITNTGWLKITDSSGSGLRYLTGPWSIPVGNKVQIRKFGKRVTVVGMVQATQDIDNTAPVALLSIPENDANFDAFSLPQVSAYELAHNHNKNAATSVQFVNGVLVALNVKQSTETPKISVELLPFASMAGIPAAKISNGDIVNFQVSWDTEA